MDLVTIGKIELSRLSKSELFDQFATSEIGLSDVEAELRLTRFGANEISTHRANSFEIIMRQLNNPILWLLSFALIISALLGDRTNALIITMIVIISIAMGFLTEYRAEKAIADLHSRITHHANVIRQGVSKSILNSELVPGDLVTLRVGSVVPADLRLIEVNALECDESLITGESLPVAKNAEPNDGDVSVNLAQMGTVVRIGTATGVVVATGARTEFGEIAKELSAQTPLTNFQIGLKQFSLFLLRIAVLIALCVVVGNIYLKRSVIESVLYALALAVGMTPQLLPAIVSTALALGSRELTKRGVVVKRLISIEDLGDLDIIITDKTGTLTSGTVNFESSYPVTDLDPVVYGLLATEGEYQRHLISLADLAPLDFALWSAKQSLLPQQVKKIAEIPFDHSRRMASALVKLDGETIIVVKGSPEEVTSRSMKVGPSELSLLDSLYKQGARVIAVAYKKVITTSNLSAVDESDLKLIGFLTFSDPPKVDVQSSIQNLEQMGIEVKLATGDSLEVSKTVCAKVGLQIKGAITGVELDQISDEQLPKVALNTTIFARVSPEQKARILLALRRTDKSVGFLGDGVNDAIALHDADVGISVDTATDVAKDAADVVLLKKDLGVLGDGIRLGRKVFNNTMKYIFMATSADFGNLVSASIGSLILPFLPMLPTQVLLQDLLYDSSQLAIPTDNVDTEQIAKPSHWNIRFIQKFMLIFGLASSIFDFLTFALLYWVLKAGESEFQTGWFIESLATATIVVLVIRTRRIPFFKSTPSKSLTLSILFINIAAFIFTLTPLAREIGFKALPLGFYVALAFIVLIYLLSVEFAKHLLFEANS